MREQIRWGISSTGGIAADFARALARVEDASLLAVSSRSRDRAGAFSAEHGVPRPYPSLTRMLDDPDIDIVYIASPHSEHCREAAQVIEAGKHVLVEKPFGLNAAQARAVFDLAAGKGVFVMEALWSRFLPAHVRLRELVANGAVGDVRTVEASFGFPFPHDPSHRLLALDLGGGALLDLGIYCVNTAMQLLGRPTEVTAVAVLGSTGVDVHTAVALRFPDQAIATARCSLVSSDPCTARVIGTTGMIEIPAMHHAPDSLVVERFFEGPAERIALPIGGDGLRYQVAEVHACLRAEVQQSEVMSWQHTLDLMTTLDRVRAVIGVTYPSDGQGPRVG